MVWYYTHNSRSTKCEGLEEKKFSIKKLDDLWYKILKCGKKEYGSDESGKGQGKFVSTFRRYITRNKCNICNKKLRISCDGATS